MMVGDTLVPGKVMSRPNLLLCHNCKKMQKSERQGPSQLQALNRKNMYVMLMELT